MSFVVNFDTSGIVPKCRRIFERDTMLALVRVVFIVVPFEIHAILSRLISQLTPSSWSPTSESFYNTEYTIQEFAPSRAVLRAWSNCWTLLATSFSWWCAGLRGKQQASACLNWL